jgi:hypothetical protein
MTPFNDLLTEAESIQSFAEINIGEDIEEAVQRGNDLIVYIARTGKMLADAKYYLNKKMNDETMKLIERILSKQKLSAKVQNSLMDSICKEEQYLVDFIERLNRTCTHQMEWCRTLVSKGKEEMRLSNVGREFQR